MRKNKMKKINYIILSIILAFLLIFLSGCSNKNSHGNGDDQMTNKLKQELSYLDYSLLNLMNRLNNLEDSRQKLVTTEVESTNGKSQETESSKSSSESGSSDASSNNSEDKNKISKLDKNSVLSGVDDSAIDWTDLQYSIETLYTSWATIEADLKKVGIGDNDILVFQDNFNLASKGLKDQNKSDALIGLNNMYLQIPVFASGFINDNYVTTLYYIKSNILSAYTYVTIGNWQEANNSLLTADQNYSNIINNNEYMSGNNSSNISKGYTLLKDLQNTISLNDTEIFLMKYKYVVEQINNLIVS